MMCPFDNIQVITWVKQNMYVNIAEKNMKIILRIQNFVLKNVIKNIGQIMQN